MLLIQEEGQAPLLSIHADAGQDLARPRIPNREYSVGVVRVCTLVVLLDASVGEICRGVEVRIHRTLDARLDNEEVIRRDVERRLRLQPPLLLLVECFVEGIVSEQEAQGSTAAVCGHTGLTDTLLLVIRPAEADLLPVTLVSSAKNLLFDHQKIRQELMMLGVQDN